jgi:hypothetical protein
LAKTVIPLAKDDISKYRFSFTTLIETIRKDNSITGHYDSLTVRLYFVGDRVVDGLATAFIFAFFPSIQSAETNLLSLLAIVPTNYQQMVIVTPSLSLVQQSIYSKLRAVSIFPVTLPPSFGEHNFKISYLAALKKRLPAGVSAQIPSLTNKQSADNEKYGYLCQDHLFILGIFPGQRSNDIFLNGHKLNLGDSLFALLLYFVVELKKGKGGWVSSAILATEGFISGSTQYQPYSNLRTALKGSLKEKDGKKFIEASGSKKYRISSHPDFVTYDKGKLLDHQHSDIRKLAKELP